MARSLRLATPQVNDELRNGSRSYSSDSTYNPQARMTKGVPSRVESPASTASRLSLRHQRMGWLSIALFGVAGLALETLHGLKVGAYLDVSSETRRLMWTLAHAHGTLLGLVHLGMAFTLESAALSGVRAERASWALVAAGWLLPAGFFLGGVQFYDGDPGVGIACVPVGAVLAIVAAADVFLLLRRRSPGPS